MNAATRTGLSRALAVLRILPGAVLAVSGYLKAVRPAAEFAAVLESYWIFPAAMVRPASVLVPWAELVVGLSLLVGFAMGISSLLAAGLYASFVAVLAQAVFRKLPMPDCGCFGQVGPHLQPIQALSLDAALLVICLCLLFDRERRWSVDRWLQKD